MSDPTHRFHVGLAAHLAGPTVRTPAIVPDRASSNR